MNKIRTNDNVIVISGHFKGTTGKVSKVLPTENKVIVEGVNARKKHVKPNSQNNEGSIKTIYCPIDLSNVAILDPKTNKPTRIGFKTVDGKKVRVTKKSNTVID